MNFISKTLLIAAALTASFSNAYAGVIIGGTRVIFDGGKKRHPSASIIPIVCLI
jgi:P pilus assembly chaperone PapD